MANISSINGNPIVPSNGSVGTAQVASGYNLMTDDEKSKLGGVPAQGNTPFSSINGNPIYLPEVDYLSRYHQHSSPFGLSLFDGESFVYNGSSTPVSVGERASYYADWFDQITAGSGTRAVVARLSDIENYPTVAQNGSFDVCLYVEVADESVSETLSVRLTTSNGWAGSVAQATVSVQKSGVYSATLVERFGKAQSGKYRYLIVEHIGGNALNVSKVALLREATLGNFLPDGSIGSRQIADGSIGDDKLEQSGGILSLVDSLVEQVGAIQVQQGGGASVDLVGYLKRADAEATYAHKSHKHAMADVTGLQAALDAKASTGTATTGAAGLMSAADKAKLDGIAEGADKSDAYTKAEADAAIASAIESAKRASEAAQDAATEEEYDRQVLAGTYQGRSLMTILGASSWADCYAMLSARAKLMDSSGIRIGDYIDVTPTSGTVNRGNAMRYRVAGMGHNYQFGDTACPWAFWMVPDDPIDMTGNTYAINTSYICWNTTENNNGVSGNEYPYLASNLRAWETGQFLPALPTALQNVLVNHRILLEKRYSSSGALKDSTGWNWVDAGKVFSLNEMEVYGCPVWGTKGWSVGEAAQLPLFRDSRYRNKSRVTWWLRSVSSGSSSYVCYVHSGGVADSYSATYTEVRPRPCFLIG